MEYQNKLRRNVALYYFYKGVQGALFYIPVWISFQQDYLSFPQMAFFASLYLFVTLFLELPTGVIADLLGKRKTMMIGALTEGLGFILLGFFPSFEMMFVYSFLVGIGGAMQSGADKAFLYDSLIELKKPEDYPHILANASFLFQLFGTISIAMGGYVFGFMRALPYALRGIFIMLSFFGMFLAVEPKIDTEKFSLNSYIRQTKLGVKEAFKNSYVAQLAIIYIFVSGFAASNQRFFAQAFMFERGVEDIERGWIAAVIKIIVASFTVFVARKKKLFRHKYFLFFLPIVTGFTLTSIDFFTTHIAVFFLAGVALASAADDAFIGSFFNKAVDSKYRATALSTLNMFAAGVYGLSNWLGGLYSDKHSVGQYYFMIGIFTVLIILPLTFNTVTHKARHEAAEI